MSPFFYLDGRLHIEQTDCQALVEQYGTPLYVYSRAAIESAWRAFAETKALASRRHLICYAVKANPNIAVLHLLAQLGSGFDIVSGGELERVLHAGGDPAKIVFSGVGKKAEEMASALEAGIHCFNVESDEELARLAQVAASHGVVAKVSLRVNPDVDAKTHPYISTGLRENKFGIPMEHALASYLRAAALPHLSIVGIDCHIGSQLIDPAPYQDALQRLLTLVDQLAERGITLSHLDIGGGQGIRYRDETALDIEAWATQVERQLGARELTLLIEPGRAIVGNAGALLTRIEYLKPGARNFAIVDAAMNDLLRPALYQAWHDIVPLRQRSGPTPLYDIVGPVCESADFLGKQRALAVRAGDALAVLSAGAYAFAMSSNYNGRGRAAEILVDGAQAGLVRTREDPAALFASECHLAEALSPGRAS